jgi:hypothetical protein
MAPSPPCLTFLRWSTVALAKLGIYLLWSVIVSAAVVVLITAVDLTIGLVQHPPHPEGPGRSQPGRVRGRLVRHRPSGRPIQRDRRADQLDIASGQGCTATPRRPGERAGPDPRWTTAAWTTHRTNPHWTRLSMDCSANTRRQHRPIPVYQQYTPKGMPAGALTPTRESDVDTADVRWWSAVSRPR